MTSRQGLPKTDEFHDLCVAGSVRAGATAQKKSRGIVI